MEQQLIDNDVVGLPRAQPKSRGWRIRLRPLMTLAGTVLLTLVLVMLPIDASRFGSFGYGVLFVLTLLSSATVLLPSPALAAALQAAKTLDPLTVGLVGGLAAGLGEATGYIAGRSGTEIVRLRERQIGRKVEAYVRRWGMLTIYVLAAIPLPLIDLAGIAAGAIGLSFWRFQAACIAGKISRFLLVAYLGRWLYTIGWL